jgi:hypothetical protein
MIDYDVISQAIKECETIQGLNRIVYGLTPGEIMEVSDHIESTKRRIRNVKRDNVGILSGC